MKRIGLLGGAFDPPHQGHLRLAERALACLELDELRLVPAAASPLKAAPRADARQRRAMLEALLAEAPPQVVLDPLELDRPGLSYTVDTLEALAAREPGAVWILVLGSDQLAAFLRWKAADRILELAALAVCPRPGFPLEVPPGLQARLRHRWSGAPGELVLLPSSELELGSTDLRKALAQGALPKGLPASVGAFLLRENLYRKTESGARMTLDPRLATVVEAARSKKAFRIRLMDVHGIASFTDTFAFMSGGSDRQNRAIAEAVEDQLRLAGERPISMEGDAGGAWILLDYGDLIVHVMDEETRRHYDLEGLWAQGRELELPPETPHPGIH
ncbi:MAG TPA: nicotinate (nicotinamide) nucleotide adenylyltransferase [Holophaga sp.]|mgnify:CR=1 FL=1|nr:nicotinate (nicotinamide) nucleotide adenylyltransferase [Holophaga sp.]